MGSRKDWHRRQAIKERLSIGLALLAIVALPLGCILAVELASQHRRGESLSVRAALQEVFGGTLRSPNEPNLPVAP